MSYNPVRAANFYKKNKSRAPINVHGGTKHSDIMRQQGIDTVNQYDNKMATNSGFSSTIFKDGFVVRTELIMPRNYSGLGVNAKKSRVFSVIRGTLYVTTPGSVTQYHPGTFFVADKGTEYGYASSGTAEVEVLIIEDVGYHKGWELLDNEAVSSAFDVESGVLKVNSTETTRRSDQTIAKAQAQTLAGTKKRGSRSQRTAKFVDAANSSNVRGVNPKAVIPTED